MQLATCVFCFHAGGSNKAEKSCKQSECDHPRSTTWVQCENCEEWKHCICAGVKHTVAKKLDFTYVCSGCKQFILLQLAVCMDLVFNISFMNVAD